MVGGCSQDECRLGIYRGADLGALGHQDFVGHSPFTLFVPHGRRLQRHKDSIRLYRAPQNEVWFRPGPKDNFVPSTHNTLVCLYVGVYSNEMLMSRETFFRPLSK